MLAPPEPAFDELSPRERGVRLARLARCALAAYGFRPRIVRRIREGFCTTFRASDGTGRTLALKAGRVGTETVESLRSEAEWSLHLGAHGLPVARFMSTSSGAPVSIGTESLAGSRPCVAYCWLPGRRQLSRVSAESARALGQLLARTHQAASAFRSSTFERKTWTVDWMCGRWSGLDPLCGQLGGSDLQLVDDWHTRIDSVCRRLERATSTWGPILADVGPHNVVWKGKSPWLIDFNDTGWGHYSYDLAILWRALSDRGVPSLERALLAGYRQIQDLPPGWGVEMQAAAIIRLLRWRAPRDSTECDRLMSRLRAINRQHT